MADIDQLAVARFALNIADVQEVERLALGWMRVAQTAEGLERYPINISYSRNVRDSLEKLRNLPIVTPTGAHTSLAEVAGIRIEDKSSLIKTESARLNDWFTLILKVVSVEITEVMLFYLNQAYVRHLKVSQGGKQVLTIENIRSTVIEGSLLRVRPIMMAVSGIIVWLLPIVLGSGTVQK